jgi:hypothetical protein
MLKALLVAGDSLSYFLKIIATRALEDLTPIIF